MELYRKPDKYYVYQHDRIVIKALKELEQRLQLSEKDKDDMFAKHSGYFREKAVQFAQDKQNWIRGQIIIDERKDRLLRQHPVPDNVKCNTCGASMLYMNHLFRNEDTEVIFVFACPKKHIPNKAVYPNGKEYSFPKRKCDNCGHQIHSTEKKKGNVLYFTDTCSGCGKVISWDLDMNFEQEPDTPVTDEDRHKYCTQYVGQKTFWQSLQAITDFIRKSDIHLNNTDKKKEEFSIDSIERLTIPQLEEKLIKKVEEAGFIKFQFDKPQIENM